MVVKKRLKLSPYKHRERSSKSAAMLKISCWSYYRIKKIHLILIRSEAVVLYFYVLLKANVTFGFAIAF